MKEGIRNELRSTREYRLDKNTRYYRLSLCAGNGLPGEQPSLPQAALWCRTRRDVLYRQSMRRHPMQVSREAAA